MKTIIANNVSESAEIAADLIRSQIEQVPASVIGLATGGTQLLVYKKLIEYHKNNGLDFSKVKTFNLDEYCGLSRNHPQSYNYYMYENLFNHINIRPENVHIPNGDCKDYDAECSSYETFIEKAGGIDLQLLGIGPNGHIGFNEPDYSLYLNTHVTELSTETQQANSRFFNSLDEVPAKAITMGIGSIMKAKSIILLANTKSKSKIMKEFFSSGINTSIPATILKLHPSVTIILDKDAAGELTA